MRNKLKILGLLIGVILVLFILKFTFFQPREILFEDSIVYGKVKSIKEISYKAALINHKPVKIKRWRRGHLTDDFICFFNEEGLPIKKKIYPAADTGTSSYMQFYKYNKKNQLINIYFNHESPKIPEYFYNTKGQLVEEKTALNVIRYDYYPNGKLHHKIQVDPEIGDEFIYTYTYENNFIKHQNVYYTVADWHIIDAYERDKHGNIIKYKFASSFNKLKTKKWDEFDYEFDCHNNWISCTHYRNKKPIYIIERAIQYY